MRNQLRMLTGDNSNDAETLATTQLLSECAEAFQRYQMTDEWLAALALSQRPLTPTAIEPLYSIGKSLVSGLATRSGESAEEEARHQMMELALRVFQTIVDFDHTHLPARRALTLALIAAGRGLEASISSRLWIELAADDEPARREAMFTLGLAQLFTDRAIQSVFTFKRMAKFFPQAQEPHLGLGLAALKLQDDRMFAQAQAALVKMDPAMGQVLVRVAEKQSFAYADLGRELALMDEPGSSQSWRPSVDRANEA